jgi:hypothetical protein
MRDRTHERSGREGGSRERVSFPEGENERTVSTALVDIRMVTTQLARATVH